MKTAILLGRTTKDPDIRYTQDNKPVAGFTLAVNGRRENDETLFIDCSAFGGTAEFVQKYVGKGTKVAIQGELTPDNYTTKDGTQIHKIRVIVQNIEFAESKSQNAAAPGPNQTAPTQNSAAPMNMQTSVNMGNQPQMPPMPPMNMGSQMLMPPMNMAPNTGYMGVPMGMPAMTPPMQGNPSPVNGSVPAGGGFTGFDASNYDPNLPFN